MKITAIEHEVHHISLLEPYTIAYESIGRCSNVTLRLITDQGLVGYGLAAPDQEITHESVDDVIRCINEIVTPLLQGQDPFRLDWYIHELKQSGQVKSSTLAMVDIALYDLMAKKAGLPLFKMLGGYRDRIETSVTIGIKPLVETMEMAERYVKSGYTTIKLKGGLILESDVEKLRKLREVYGSSIGLRFDANQGYTTSQSLDFIHHTEHLEIEIFEQPTKYNNLSAIQQVTEKSTIPVMGDESIRSMKDAIHFVKHNALDMMSIKLQKVGGILESKHINSIAKSNGLETMVSCLDECSLGIAAGLHFALSKPNLEYADLDGHLDMLNDPYIGLFTIENGMMVPNGKPGLGI